MPHAHRLLAGRPGATCLLLVGVGSLLGLASALGIAAALAARHQPSIVGGRETIRFPDQDRCGLVVWRRDEPGVIEMTVQSGAVLRMGGDFDATPGAVERLVPAGWRDRTVPWGWAGGWEIGMRRVRHVVAFGWPWPRAIAVLEAAGDSPDGPGGWRPVEGRLNGPAAASPWDPRMPKVWPTAIETGPFLANSSLFALGWTVLIAGFRTAGRRWVRSRRHRCGRCPWCGYPLASGGEVTERACPECGRTP